MKKIYRLSICMLVFCVTVSSVTVVGINNEKSITWQSNGPDIEWMHTFDSIIQDYAYYVNQTADGGYVFTGSTVVTEPGYTELLLAKTDGNGEISWYNNFPLTGLFLYGTVVHQTTDGGYIIVGSIGYTWLWNIIVTKADANGDLVWQKSFGKNDGCDHGCDILQTSDGGYIVLGVTTSYGQGDFDLWLIKLASDGSEQWNKTIGGVSFDEPISFMKAVDGGYVIVGQTDAFDYMGDVWVVKTDDTGELSWQKTFGNYGFAEDGVCIKAVSNGYIILGNHQDQDENSTESLWLLQLDVQGNLTWDKQIFVNGTVHSSSITTTMDGGYFITSTISNDNWVSSNVYLLKLDHQGATQWIKTLDIPNMSIDRANWGIQARDGGFIVVGNTGEIEYQPSDIFILKIKAEKNVVLESVTGGFGVQAHLKNLGSSEAIDVNVKIKITGAILNHINISYIDTISIPSGKEAIVSCKPFLGLGPIDIAVTVNGVTNNYDGVQLIILTMLQSDVYS
jgi:hypothetical protein